MVEVDEETIITTIITTDDLLEGWGVTTIITITTMGAVDEEITITTITTMDAESEMCEPFVFFKQIVLARYQISIQINFV